jgi:hypothetical protein
VTQSTTYFEKIPFHAERAVDDNLVTISHTMCAWNTDVWYNMNFDDVYCFSEIWINKAKDNEYRLRMHDTKVFVVNTTTKSQALCGKLALNGAGNQQGQPYKIRCDLKCGNQVKLTVRHDQGKYNYQACIHMREIKAFRSGNRK